LAFACLLQTIAGCDSPGATATGSGPGRGATVQNDGSTGNDSASTGKTQPPGQGASDTDSTGAPDGGFFAPDGPDQGSSDDGGLDEDGADEGDDSDFVSDGGAPAPDGADDAAGPSIEVEGSAAGQPCVSNDDCASGLCGGSVCVDATSCLTLLQANPGLPNREYEIDPDGPGTGLAPFVAYCDMTTDGGGWTTLPLRFNDPNYWSITQDGDACVTIDIEDDSGNFRQYQSLSDVTYDYTYMEFVPPIAATSVWFVNFNYTNGGQNNTMDFQIGGVPSPPNTSYEGWYFADPSAPAVPLGYTFPTDASCTPPYDIEHDVTCSRDALTDKGDAPTAPFFLNETVPLSAAAPNFDMVLMQGCPSYPLMPFITGEQFHIETGPAADGVWTTGIAVR